MESRTTLTPNEYARWIQQQYAGIEVSPLYLEFHEQTKTFARTGRAPSPITILPEHLCALSQRAYKEYPLSSRIVLPEPEPLDRAFSDVVMGRRTVRQFRSIPIPLGVVATLLGCSYRVLRSGVEQNDVSAFPHRPIPSGGALYPLEVYAVVFRVTDLEPGLYHYHPDAHVLETLRIGDLHQDVARFVVQASQVADASLGVLITGIPLRTYFKYGELGFRLLLLEAGHLVQNMALISTAFDLGSLPCCGFYDDLVHDFIGVDGQNEACVYQLWIGHPKSLR